MNNKFKSGRIIGVFGLPCSGKTTLINTIISSSKEIIARISSGDIARRLSTENEISHMAKGNLFPHEEPLRKEIASFIDKRRASGAEAIILDGFPRTSDQVQWMLDNQYAGTELEGCLILVRGDNLVQRAQERYRDDQDSIDKVLKKIDTQDKDISNMEKTIFSLSIPYFTVHNTDLALAAKNFSKFIGIKK